jgi:hypothetical protein
MRYKAKSVAVPQLPLGDLPRATADYDEWSSTVLRSHLPDGRSAHRRLIRQSVIRFMAADHFTPILYGCVVRQMRDKLNVTRARGARFSSVRFVTESLIRLQLSLELRACLCRPVSSRCTRNFTTVADAIQTFLADRHRCVWRLTSSERQKNFFDLSCAHAITLA